MRKMRKKFIFLLIILLVNISFLFSGPPEAKGPESYCPHRYVRLNSFMGVPVNCDEFVFIGAAVRPTYLIQPGFQRQNRPGYVLLGTAVGYTIYYVLYPFHESLKSFAYKKLSGQFSYRELEKAVLYGSVYAGYIIINVLILFLTMVLFEKSMYMVSGSWKNQQWLFWLCLVMLISNQVTKTFFWTAHQQMFTLFTPVACLYAGMKVYSHNNARKLLLIMASVTGLLLLVYGNFLLVLPVMLGSYMLKLRTHKKILSSSALSAMCLSILIFFLPTLLWISYLRMTGISYYNHEISQFRHFIWLADSWNISFDYFLKKIYANTITFVQTSGSLLPGTLFLMTAILCRSINSIKRPAMRKDIFSPDNRNILLLAFLLFAVFLWLMGAYADRLTLSFAPFLIFIAVQYVNADKLSIKIQWILGVVILSMHLYMIFFNAPHLSDELFFQ